MGTGGIGGVHRGFAERPDISADLAELARTQALVVGSGAKSLLDVPATAEALETLGVPVLGYRTDELPLFYAAGGGPPVSARVESADEAARDRASHWELGGAASCSRNPPESGIDVEPLDRRGARRPPRQGVTGQAVTPFVLACLHERSGGRTLEVNRELDRRERPARRRRRQSRSAAKLRIAQPGPRRCLRLDRARDGSVERPGTVVGERA